MTSITKSATSNSTVKILPDENLFLPVSDGNGGFELKVSRLSEQMQIPPRTSFVMDCGLRLTKPNGVRVAFEVSSDWAKKGLLLLPVVSDERLIVIACNAGKQILAFNHGENVGSFYFVSSNKVFVKVEK